MAERAFTPKNLGVAQEWFADTVEQRLTHSGEYVIHKPYGGLEQNVVMNYQYIPEDAGIGKDYIVEATNPTLYGYLPHFDDQPKIYIDGNGKRETTGSQFEVRGLLYNVKRVDVNHRGYMVIEMVLADYCEPSRDDFDDDMDELICKPECADIPEPKTRGRIWKEC